MTRCDCTRTQGLGGDTGIWPIIRSYLYLYVSNKITSTSLPSMLRWLLVLVAWGEYSNSPAH